MKLKNYLALCVLVTLIGYLLRISIDSYTKQGRYKDPNELTHFEKQLNLQKQLHKKSNNNDDDE